eukprot:CAMPEP_0182441758 /NCGR_PEP_ID=MMETSP1172-20130603/765_1 /TAXON_ID=708627 /ORGANISM="Timspurckia oligopyrenoides, Strain CCMP3278" /LENGTH=209 /DNA_ID=CAMNT_0024636279 /DNA_START=51 /DNA_END=680 /DNA_ORIENTATION=-
MEECFVRGTGRKVVDEKWTLASVEFNNESIDQEVNSHVLDWDEFGVSASVLRSEIFHICGVDGSGISSHSSRVEQTFRPEQHNFLVRDPASDSECSFLTPNVTPDFGPNELPIGAAELPELDLAKEVSPVFVTSPGSKGRVTSSEAESPIVLDLPVKKKGRSVRQRPKPEANGKYAYRKKMAKSRPRINGRFVPIDDKEAVRRAMEKME